MSIWKAALISGVAMSTLFTLGMANKAVSGHGYHDFSMPSYHQQHKHNADHKTKHFKHPIYGYQFKHPVYGYIPMTTVGKTRQPGAE